MTQISIITPVYNAAKYLARTIESIQAQTYADWELLLVNDGSTDNSTDIIERYAANDSRIRLISQQNSGPARARNNGIEHSEGRYICFVDSDDTIEPNMLQRLNDTAIQFGANIVMCNFATVTNGKRIESHHGFASNCVLTNEQLENEVLRRYFEGRNAGVASLCTKYIDRSWLNGKNIVIPENRVRAEDWLFNLNCLEACPRFCAIDDVLYNYWQNEGSIMHSVREGEWKQHFDSMNILRDVNNRHSFHYDVQINTQCVNGAIGHMLSAYGCSPARTDIAEQILHFSDLKEALSNANLRLLPKAFRLIAFAMKLKQYRAVKFLLKLFTR